MINQVTLVGNLGTDPELKAVKEGKNVCTFRLATNEKWKTSTGELREETQWHTITAWDKLAENCAKSLYKGRLVFVQGKIRNRSYEKDGQTKFATEVVAEDIKFLDKPDRDRQKNNGDVKAAEYKTPF
jgi:single-strand DNA-binding protein